MGSLLFLLLFMLSISDGVSAVNIVDGKGSALFTDLILEIVDSYAIPDQVSDLYLKITLPFDEARSSATHPNATDLWRAKAWASTLKQGGGEKVGFEKQILSELQAGTPLDLSENPMVIDEVIYPIDLVGHDCSVATFVCIRFQAWENGPEVLFEYENGKKIARATECVPVNCTDDPCVGIYCDIPVCEEGHYIDYTGDDCCPGCIPGGPINATESDEIKSLNCGEHKEGDRWIQRQDELNCLEMQCDAGEIIASAQQCPETECDNPLYPADSCCPVCLAPPRDRCSLEPSRGRCLAYFGRYYFNPTSGSCESFVYGGCGGNDNRFDSIKDCEEACGSPEEIKSLDCGEHKDGDRWIDRVDEWNCRMMSCNAGSEIMAMVTCARPECDSPAYPEDSCCPVCPEEEAVFTTALPDAVGTELVDVERTTWVDDVEVIELVEPEVDPEVMEPEDAELTTLQEDLTTVPSPEVYTSRTVSSGPMDCRVDECHFMMSCDSDEVKMAMVTCAQPECDDPVYPAARCCPVCPEEEASFTTALPDAVVTELVDVEHTTWVDDVGGIEVVEPEVDPEVKDPEYAELTTVQEDLSTVTEIYTSRIFIYVDRCEGHGELGTWEPQPCERCTCIDGAPICSQPNCAEPECDNPLPAVGLCCQVCPEPKCVEGDEWSPDLCTQCTCEGGEEVCEPVVCPVTGCLNPRKVAGECCKKCLAPLRARPMNIRGEVTPRVWRAGRTLNPRFSFEIRTFPTSENVTGEGLWKLSIWVDSKMDGTGDRLFFKEQVLSPKQASEPLYASQSTIFNNVRFPVGGPGIDCPETVHYYCFRFQMGDDPSVSFRFLAPRQQSFVSRCIRAPCVK